MHPAALPPTRPHARRAMKLYPDVRARLIGTVARDVAVVLLIALFAWFGYQTYQAVDALTVLGSGVREAGTSLQESFTGAAGAVDGIPIVGQRLSSALQSTGRSTGGRLVVLGQQGIDKVHRLALTVGLVMAALPTVLLLAFTLPGRLRQIQALTASSVVLQSPDDVGRRRMVAMRAAFGLPYGALLAYTRDPLGDLLEGRYDGLVDAALDDAGLRPRGRRLPEIPPGEAGP